MKKIKYLYYCSEVRTAIYMSNIISTKEDCDDHIFFFPHLQRALPPAIQNRKNFVYMCSGGTVKRFLFRMKMFLKAEHIIFLAIYHRDITIPQLLLIPKRIMQKSAWIETTGDTYSWKNQSVTHLDCFYNWCRKKLMASFPLVAVTFPSNEVQYRRMIGNGKTVHLPLGTFEQDFLHLDLFPSNPYGSKQSIWVQVGHSGIQGGNHVKLLNVLKKFKDNNIKVITVATNSMDVSWAGHYFTGIPYRNAVFRAAKSIFGDKACNFGRPVDLESYHRFTHNVDILVLDINRGAALGNIARALYLGKKVFLPSGNEFYDFWISQGFHIYDTNKIPEMTFEEFIQPPEPNDDYTIDFWKPDNLEKRWDEFYRELDNL